MIGHYDGNEALLQRRHTAESLDRGLAIYHPLTSLVGTLPTGQLASNVNAEAVSAATYLGVPCLRFTNGGGSAYISIPFTGKEYGRGWKGAMSIWVAKDGLSTRGRNKPMLIMPRGFSSTASSRLGLGKRANGDLVAYGTNGDGTQNNLFLMDSVQAAGFHHVAMNIAIDAGTSSVRSADVYLDGAYAGNVSTNQKTNYDFQAVQAGLYGADSDESDPGSVLLSGLRVWNRQLTDEEIMLLAHEFSPAAP